MLVSGNLIKYPKWMAELLQLVWRLSWPILITRASPVRPIRGYYYLMSNKCHTRRTPVRYVSFPLSAFPKSSPLALEGIPLFVRVGRERGREGGREIRANELRMQKLAHSCRHGCALKFFDHHHPETEMEWNEVWGKGGGKLVETFGKFPPWESYLRR